MFKLELVKVDVDTKKTYKPSDNIQFRLILNNHEYIKEDIEFEVIYFGDSQSDNYDQRIANVVVGQLDPGKLSLDIVTDPIDLTKIPIKLLFGVTTILIVGKWKGRQFIRIGYVISVNYPGISQEKLVCGDDEECDGECDGECDDECDGECDDEGSDSEDDEDDSEEVELMDDDELDYEECDNEECGDNQEEYNTIMDALMPKTQRPPVPLVTPIVEDKDEFEYNGFSMKKSLIQIEMHESPIVSVFEVDWPIEKKEIEESTESQDEEIKKQKHE